MRAAILGLVALLLLPTALAAQTYEHRYIVFGEGNGGGGALIRNGESYAPVKGFSNVTVEIADISGGPVFLRLCHEWTFNDGSHAKNTCVKACATSLADSMLYPPYPDWDEPGGATYRVIVTLNDPSLPCPEATTGTLRVTFR